MRRCYVNLFIVIDYTDIVINVVSRRNAIAVEIIGKTRYHERVVDPGRTRLGTQVL